MDKQEWITLVKSLKVGKKLPDAIYVHSTAITAPKARGSYRRSPGQVYSSC